MTDKYCRCKMCYKHMFLLIVVVSSILPCICYKEFAGPYRVVFRGVVKCKDRGIDSIWYTTKYNKINRTHNAYTGNLTIDRPFSDKLQWSNDISIYGNGGWKENFLHVKFNRACTDLKLMLPTVMETFYAASGKKFTGCPAEKKFEVKNWVFNVRLNTDIFPYGRYKIVSKIWEEPVLLTCFILELGIEPKERELKHNHTNKINAHKP